MKINKKLLYVICLIMLLTFTACSSSDDRSSVESEAPTVTEDTNTDNEEQATEVNDENADATDETIVFTDSIGREVEIPSDIERIAPSGPMATVVLYTLCPDKLVGLGSKWSDDQLQYIDDKYKDLPVFGNFYADTLNLEAVMVADPQIVIDVGEAKPSAADDMKGVQDKTGIPSVFISMTLEEMPEAYRTLGKLVGEEERGEELAQYAEDTLNMAKENSASISDADRKKVYYAQGDAGLTAYVDGTVHTEVIDLVGGDNVVDVEQSLRGGSSEISMEQLMLWQPDIILFTQGSIYNDVKNRPEWAGINAVEEDAVYEVPVGLYDWMGRPPSVNRIIGIKWLGNLLYPDIYDYDMVKETKDFYKLFYNYDMTDAHAEELLSKSTLK